MTTTAVFLILTLVMPGQQPDLKKSIKMPDLETCEVRAHSELRDEAMFEFSLKFGAVGPMAGCLVVTSDKGESKGDL